MTNKVTILMATYNGSRFIKEQIESIINQTYGNWELIIRDDASSDTTARIVKSFLNKDKRMRFFVNDNNLGPVMNFNELLNDNLNVSYIMFSDQDDVWKPNKIEISLKKILEIENQKGISEPILIYTGMDYVNEELKYLDIKSCQSEQRSLTTLLGFNYMWGCTMLINQALANISYPIECVAQNHDYWIALHAKISGTVVFIPDSTILYRQHSCNVTGGAINRSFLNKCSRVKKIYKSYNIQTQQNLYICNLYSHKNNDILIKYESVYKSKGFKAVYCALKLHLKKSTFLDSVLYYIYIFNHSY